MKTAKRVVYLWLIVILKVQASSSVDVSSGQAHKMSVSKIIANYTKTPVPFFKEQAGVDAYSGYITVRNGSHFFYLLMKTPWVKSNAPLILWLQGGPGKSGMFGQFLENGPIGIDAEGNLFNRSSTYLNFSDVLYVDYPAGGGLSIIENPFVLSRSLDNVTDDLLTFLEKFYLLFPEYLTRHLYLAGESYGARAAVSLAKRMKTDCASHPHGVMLFAGFLIPLEESILKSQEFLYQLCMLDDKGRQQLEERFKMIQGAAKSNTTAAALMLAVTVFNLRIGGKRSLFANLTGYDDQGSVLHTTKPPEIRKYEEYVNSSDFKQKLGIPVPEMVSLEQYRLPIQFALAPGDYFTNITDIFQEVLESERVLIVNGQMDNIFPAVLFDEYFNNMTWNGSAEFRDCPRKPWKTHEQQYGLTGYMKECGNLTTALALKAGHLLGFDASDAIFDIVSRFVNASNYDIQEQNNVQ